MRLPSDTDARLGLVAGVYFVFLARPPQQAGTHLLELLATPGNMTTLLTHDPGVSWPDRRGIGLAEATLAAGGVVILQFERMADALACHRRLLHASARP